MSKSSGSVIDGSDHVCISWDPALPALEIYFDGVSVAVSNVNIAAPFAYFFNRPQCTGFTSPKDLLLNSKVYARYHGDQHFPM